MHDQIFVLGKRCDTLKNVLKDYEDHKTLLQENIFYNNQAFMELNEDACYEPIGNGTEVGLLKWLQDANFPIPKNL